ncbi:MAG TPA: aldehyde dehydrogenase family protein [Gemmatimonadales bacterium]|nr:aldehyde dehydrogenase family protein [Gemmatimonadales bacterium]
MTAAADLRTYPYLLGGELKAGTGSLEVRSPYSNEPIGHAALAGSDEVVAAIDAAVAAAPAAAALPSHARAAVLDRIGAGLAARREELARLLAAEAGKPLALARAEIDRAVFVFRQGAEEAVRLGGEVIPMDLQPHGERRWGLTRRFPLSPVSAIIPFNFPVLLAAHKLAPALACGATVVLKPPPQDPLATLLLGEIVRDSGYPAGGVAILLATNEAAAPLIDDPRVRVITFTGSTRAGWAIRRRAPTKRVTLELGGNAAVIIEPDADLDHAVRRCVAGGYLYAGQSCISTQRILVHHSTYSAFVARYVAAVAALRTGDPLAETTDVGPMIDQASAERAEAWIAEAAAAGAQVAVGGGREGAVLAPAVLLDTTAEMRVNCEEVFAPVTTVRPYADLDQAIAMVNDSAYGIQAGLFTHDMRRILRAFERIEVGGLVVNDVPGFRVDHAPYGGVKESGQGREGVRYAIEEMTELRLLVIGDT